MIHKPLARAQLPAHPSLRSAGGGGHQGKGVAPSWAQGGLKKQCPLKDKSGNNRSNQDLHGGDFLGPQPPIAEAPSTQPWKSCFGFINESGSWTFLAQEENLLSLWDCSRQVLAKQPQRTRTAVSRH